MGAGVPGKAWQSLELVRMDAFERSLGTMNEVRVRMHAAELHRRV